MTGRDGQGAETELALVFDAGGIRYGLDIARVREVVPMVALRPVPSAPGSVAGTFNYRGTLVPVIDLAMLLTGRPCRPLLCSRVMLVDYRGHDGQPRVLGVLAEGVTETRRMAVREAQPPGVSPDEARYLGRMLVEESSLIQLIEVDELLPESLKRILFA